MNNNLSEDPSSRLNHVKSDKPFFLGLWILGGFYFVMIVLMIVADLGYLVFKKEGLNALSKALNDPKVRYSIKLSLLSCTMTTIFSLWVAVPIAYVMSRFEFRGKRALDAILDIPIVLPPMVIGLSLLILFNFPPFSWTNKWIVYEVGGVVLAQFMVACAFAVRTMRVTFDQISTRYENVALTLGCSRGQAFWKVVMPQTRMGLIAAATLAWARSLGEFGPILVFAGSTRLKTEVLPTTVYLEMQAGNLPGMLAISIIMIVMAGGVLLLARMAGLRRLNR